MRERTMPQSKKRKDKRGMAVKHTPQSLREKEATERSALVGV